MSSWHIYEYEFVTHIRIWVRYTHIGSVCPLYSYDTVNWVASWLLTATHCNTLQRTATHCNTLQHTMYVCIPRNCNTLQHNWVASWLLTTTQCNTPQHTATHYVCAHTSQLQHTATHLSSKLIFDKFYLAQSHTAVPHACHRVHLRPLAYHRRPPPLHAHAREGRSVW